MEALRRLGLKGTAWAEAQVDTIRLKLLKIGAIVRVSVRRVLLQLSSAYRWKIGERLLTGGNYVVFTVFVVPQLGGDPEFIAAQPAAQQFQQNVPNPVLIAIHRCAIEVPVADARGVSHRLSYGIVRNMVRTERSQADRGYFGAARQRP